MGAVSAGVLLSALLTAGASRAEVVSTFTGPNPHIHGSGYGPYQGQSFILPNGFTRLDQISLVFTDSAPLALFVNRFDTGTGLLLGESVSVNLAFSGELFVDSPLGYVLTSTDQLGLTLDPGSTYLAWFAAGSRSWYAVCCGTDSYTDGVEYDLLSGTPSDVWSADPSDVTHDLAFRFLFSAGVCRSLTAGNDTCAIDASTSISGASDALAGIDTIELGGATDFTFDADAIGVNFLNFEAVRKTGASTVTLTGDSALAVTIAEGALTVAADGAITTSGDAVIMANGTELTNAGAISAATGSGVILTGAGTVQNQAGGVITGGASGHGIVAAGALDLTNAGTITYAGGAITSMGYGAYAGAGGTIDNLAGGVIEGRWAGVRSVGGLTLENAGTITGARFAGIEVNGDSSITNLDGGVIRGLTGEGSGVLQNDASLSIDNRAGGLITGAGEAGVWSRGGALLTITNGGTISGTGTAHGVLAYTTNFSLTNEAGGVISSANQTGVTTIAAGASITNAGSISGATGALLALGGEVRNSGVIHGSTYAGVETRGTDNLVVNSGTISGLWGVSDLEIGGAMLVENSGLITGARHAVITSGRLTVDNQEGGVMRGGSYNAAYAGGANSQIINAGLMEGGNAGVYVDGAGVAIVNTGTIRVTGTTEPVTPRVTSGIYVSATGASVDNAGVIESSAANGRGVFLAGGSGVITNRAGGTISGNGDGAAILLAGSGYTLDLQAGSTVNGAIDASATTGLNLVTVAGTLNGGYYGGSGRDEVTLTTGASVGLLDGGAGVDALTLAGTGAATLDLGRIFNFETHNKIGDGTWALTGTATGNGAWNVQAGELRLAGSMGGPLTVEGGRLTGFAEIAGALRLTSGSISPGFDNPAHGPGLGLIQASSLTVTGGTLNFGFAGADKNFASDLILLTGAVNLSGGSIDARPISALSEYGFNQQYVLVAGSSVSGQFANLTDFAPNAYEGRLQQRLRYDVVPGAVVLEVRRMVDWSEDAQTKLQSMIGDVLENAQLGSSDDWAGIMNALIELTPEQRRAAFEDMSGEGLANVTTSTMQFGDRFQGVMQGRMGGAAAGSGGGATAFAALPFGQGARPDVMAGALAMTESGAQGQAGAWAEAFVVDSELKGRGGAADTGSQGGGFASGFDVEAAPGWRLGVAAGYSDMEADTSDRATASKGQFWHVGAYLGYEEGPWYAGAAASRMSGDVDVARRVGLGPITLDVTGRTEVEATNLSASFGRKFRLGETTELRAGFTGTASQVRQDAYTETGAGGLSLDVAEVERTLWIGELGGRLTRELNGGALKPYVGAGVAYAGGDLDSLTSVSFIGAPVGSGAFVVGGAELPPAWGKLEAGLAFRPREQVWVSLGYDGALADRLQEHRGTMKVSVRW